MRSTLLQHHISKASIQRLSAVFMVQDSEPYANMGNTSVLNRTFLVFLDICLSNHILSRFDIAVLASVIRLLISGSHPPPSVIRDPRYINSFTVSTLLGRFFSCKVSLLSMTISLVLSRLISRPKARLSLVTRSRRLAISSSSLATKVVSSAYLRLFIFFPLIDTPPS